MKKRNRLWAVAGAILIVTVALGAGSSEERRAVDHPAEVLLANFSCQSTSPPDPGFVIASFRYAATGNVTEGLSGNNRFFDDAPVDTCARLAEAMHGTVNRSGCTVAQVVDLSDGAGTLLTFEFSCTARRNRIVQIIGGLSGALLEASRGDG